MDIAYLNFGEIEMETADSRNGVCRLLGVSLFEYLIPHQIQTNRSLKR